MEMVACQRTECMAACWINTRWVTFYYCFQCDFPGTWNVGWVTCSASGRLIVNEIDEYINICIALPFGSTALLKECFKMLILSGCLLIWFKNFGYEWYSWFFKISFSLWGWVPMSLVGLWCQRHVPLFLLARKSRPRVLQREWPVHRNHHQCVGKESAPLWLWWIHEDLL